VFGFGGRATIGKHALVYDDTGGYEAVSVVEQLITQQCAVTFATRHESVGSTVEFRPATVYPARERMAAAGIEIVPLAYLSEITGEDAELVLSQGAARRRVPADTVVLVGYNRPNRENADALADAGFPVHLVGDATGSRTIQQAIRHAAEVTRGI
jgi:hypothetical protein